jgi:hypothetical protein
MTLTAIMAIAGTMVASAGCFQVTCDERAMCTPPGTGGTTTTTGPGGSGGGGGKPDCSGEPNTINTVEDCGVFVQADALDANGDGTRAKPYQTLQEALDKAGDKRVYACASAPFVEAVTISAGVELFGGFACAKDWTWSQAAKSMLNGPADQIALTLASGADEAKVENFAVVAASASAAKKGGSSIAVAVADVAAELVRCDVTARDGVDGADGLTPQEPVVNGANATLPDAATMNACIAPNAVNGGAPGITVCEDGMSLGGVGGKGGVTGTDSGNGQKGADGEPSDVAKGKGGIGADAVNDCEDGAKGKSGASGPAGSGGVSPGTLSLTGLTTDEDTGGKSGTRAQGGGGGGGAKAGLFCPPGGITDGVGASGGGGGAGGCGGKGGGGGKAGGSSIAVLSLGTKLTLTQVTLATGKGGAGGKGVVGQNGGDPGIGAGGGAKSATPPSANGCKGGDGGPGGPGGPGGGGRGGHSLGLAYAKSPAVPPKLNTFTQGMPGDGGTAGQGAPMTSNGAKGTLGQCWDFGKNKSCSP